MATPKYTQFTLKKLRDDGYVPWIVERYNSFSGKKSDLFGFADIIAIKPGEILAVQSTSYKAASPHRKMMRGSELVPLWKKAGGRAELWLWKKPKFRWELIVEEY